MDIWKAAKSKERGTFVKYKHYLDCYEFHFRPYASKKIKLLEIGVQGGGSLWLWKKYFKAAKIYGIDTDPNCKTWEGDNVDIFIGSQDDKKFLQQVINHAAPWDIIIDDGGHKMNQQLTSFESLFSNLNEGGVYVIEDLHTSYWPEFEGGEGRTTIAMLKTLIDKLHWWACRSSRAERFQKKENDLDYLEFFVSSVHIYDSICFVYKKKTSLPERVSF